MQVSSPITDATMGLSLNDEKVPFVSTTALEVAETSTKILAIIFEYALNKFDDTPERLAAGMAQMCLPAFPFKSANKVYKVLGTPARQGRGVGPG
ncbi:hypothetical protein NM208_g834 [Fusarium decemcellulare]|uniref:Uncharacterized protein n=1 Tax=Fusarium decemcellulare TaxID=57161 RepID=A0ACC1SYF1_9HYPO|nr:hypothetical protein NM208_g834 [Fusarium decemcellulare]